MAQGPKFNRDAILKSIETHIDSRISSMSDSQSKITVSLTNWYSVLSEKPEIRSALEKLYKEAGWTNVKVELGYTGQRDGDPYSNIVLSI